MSERCPRGVHPYPEARDTGMNHGRPYFFCRWCKRERDVQYHRLNSSGPYEPDDFAVLRAVKGDPPDWLHPSERRLAAQQLMNMSDVSLSQAADRLLCTPRHVSRLYRYIKTGSWK